MTVVVNGQQKSLAAFANVDSDGQKDAVNGVFQCTALVAQYLTLLGFKNAPSELPNGKNVASFLAKADGQYFSSSSMAAPKVGSIISFGPIGSADTAGHVAIVKGITMQNDGTIVVTLIEDNYTLQGQNTFAVNRTLTFVQGSNGTWSSPNVVGWVTPTSLP